MLLPGFISFAIFHSVLLKFPYFVSTFTDENKMCFADNVQNMLQKAHACTFPFEISHCPFAFIATSVLCNSFHIQTTKMKCKTCILLVCSFLFYINPSSFIHVNISKLHSIFCFASDDKMCDKDGSICFQEIFMLSGFLKLFIDCTHKKVNCDSAFSKMHGIADNFSF